MNGAVERKSDPTSIEPCTDPEAFILFLDEPVTVLPTSENGFAPVPGFHVCAHCGQRNRMERDHLSHECVPPPERRFHVHVYKP